MNARNPAFDAMTNPVQISQIGLDTLFTTCEQLQQAGQATEALALYQAWLAQSQDANRHMAWFNYGSLQQSTGNPAAAVDAYKECLALQPSFPQALINLGLTLEKMGKRDEALQQLAAPLPKDFVPLAADRRGDILLAQGKKAEAKTQYEAAYKGLDERSDYRRIIEVKLNALGVDPVVKAAVPVANEAAK